MSLLVGLGAVSSSFQPGLLLSWTQAGSMGTVQYLLLFVVRQSMASAASNALLLDMGASESLGGSSKAALDSTIRLPFRVIKTGNRVARCG